MQMHKYTEAAVRMDETIPPSSLQLLEASAIVPSGQNRFLTMT